jgi:hypothetical protein
MKSNDAILSYPFSGPLYSLLSGSVGDDHAQSNSMYYKTQVGINRERITDMALTLAVIYDNIIMPGVNMPLLGEAKYLANGMYHNIELGIKCYPLDSYSQFPGYHETTSIISSNLADTHVQKLLRKVPRHGQPQILNQAHDEIRLAILTGTRVLCSPGRSLLIKRLLELNYIDRHIEASNRVIIEAVKLYKEIFGFIFSPASIEEFHVIKTDHLIRDYARRFTDTIHGFNTTESTHQQLADAMETAINTADIAEKVSGVFSYTSTVMGIAGLLPIVGMVPGAIGIASDVLAKGTESAQKRNEWYQLAPKIAEKRSQRQIHDFIASHRAKAIT